MDVSSAGNTAASAGPFREHQAFEVQPEAVAVESLRVATGAKKAEFSGTPAEQEMQRLSNIVVSKMLSYRREHDAKVAS